MLNKVLKSLIFVNLFFRTVFGLGNDFFSGIIHPIIGIDHLLSMVAVGVVSTQKGEKNVWFIPSFFVLFMIIGGFLGFKELPLAGVEVGISLSVFLLGLSIALESKLKTIWTIVFVSIFGLFHGYAHGLEIPYLANKNIYVFGFVIATISLHLIGVVIGYLSSKFELRDFLKYVGAGISGIGFALLFNL